MIYRVKNVSGRTNPGVESGRAAPFRQTFAVAIPTLAGPLTISLTGETFVYRIAPYDYSGITCRSVTYNGTLTS